MLVMSKFRAGAPRRNLQNKVRSGMSVWEHLLLWAYVLTIFQDPIKELLSFASVDEIFSVFCLLLIAGCLIKQRFVITLPCNVRRSFSCFVAVLGLALISNLWFGYQSMLYVLLDLFSEIRFYLGLFCAVLLFPTGISSSCAKKLANISSCIIVVYFFLAVHDFLFTPFFNVLYDGGRNWIQLFYSNVTYLAAYTIFLLCVVVKTRNHIRHFGLIFAMAVVVVALTGRSKAWGFVILAIALILGDKIKQRKRLLFLSPLLIVGIVFVAWEKIELYFFNASHYSPRKNLLDGAFMFASEHFPLGTGLGTYCSIGSILNISPLYGRIGYNYFTAAYDMFWGCVIGQAGWTGAVFFVFSILFLGLAILKLYRVGKNEFVSAILALLYLVIASFGECSFFSPYSLGYGFLIGLAFGQIMKKPVRTAPSD